MRLVSRQFEAGVSGYLFKVVVVPFKPELYGVAPAPSIGMQNNTLTSVAPGSILLQDKGLRIFAGFGEWIKKFAMSFEFDEAKLANPPNKNDQVAVQSFWGIYRWPHQKYNRYSQLEGLELTADETRTMAKALRCLTNATELGLSIDGGLGWLPGPDTNVKVTQKQPKVFGKSRFVPEPSASRLEPSDTRFSESSESSESSASTSSSRLQSMMEDAGVPQDSIDEAIQLLVELDPEARELYAVSQPTSDAPPPAPSFRTLPRDRLRGRSIQTPLSRRNQAGQVTPNQSFGAATAHDTNTPPLIDEDVDLDLEHELGIEEVTEGVTGTFSDSVYGRSAYMRDARKLLNPGPIYLKPNDLTTAQKEMLLEVEWAQRAFMQSYAIAVIDNPTAFNGIKTLTIARLPNRHLPILRREDFWDGLPNLQELFLAIIPDWREVVKLPTSYVEDNRLLPSKAVAGVYQLLHEQISRRANIKILHFEWICGGELAPGLFARNKLILPAPLVPEASNMIVRNHQQPDVLSLPHVKKLTLKNCWVSPHIMDRFVRSFKNTDLKHLVFDSVSLTADLPLNALAVFHNDRIHHAPQAWANWVQNFAQNQNQNNGAPVPPPPPGPIPPVGHHALQQAAALAAAHMANQGPGANAQVHVQVNMPPALQAAAAAAATANAIPQDWLDIRNGSWPQILDKLTMDQYKSIEHHRRTRDDQFYDIPNDMPLQNPSGLALDTVEFTSCGYARLPIDVDQGVLDSPDLPAAETSIHQKRRSDIENHMMVAADFGLAAIVNNVNVREMRQLQSVFVMQFGWDFLLQPYCNLAAEASLDGVTKAGDGRFSGYLTHREPLKDA